MRRYTTTALFFILSLAATAAPAPQGFRMDLSASGSLPVTWYEGGPALAHSGGGFAVGAEYDLASWIPGRFELSYFGDGASAISASGELYRAWHGLRIAAYGGYRLPAFDLFHSSSPLLSLQRVSFLAGGALTAAGYSGTNLAFAYPSLLAEARLDIGMAAENSFWIGLPFEYMFRGAFSTASAGLVLGWRMGPLTENAKRPKSGMRPEDAKRPEGSQ
jgi:hypothetical protein